MSSVSTPALAISVFLTAFSAFGAGYLMSPAPERTGDSRPIVDPDAWNKTGPVQPAFQALAQPEVVDAAMEEAADDAAQRGWVAPDDFSVSGYQDASYRETSQQADIPPLDTSNNAEASSYDAGYTVEPLEGAATSGGQGSATIKVLGKAEADRAWDDWPSAPRKSEQATSAAPINTTPISTPAISTKPVSATSISNGTISIATDSGEPISLTR